MQSKSYITNSIIAIVDNIYQNCVGNMKTYIKSGEMEMQSIMDEMEIQRVMYTGT